MGGMACRRGSRFCMTVGAALLSACASTPMPEFHVDVPAAWGAPGVTLRPDGGGRLVEPGGTASSANSAGSAEPAAWWTQFNDATLDRLLARALRVNNALTAADARVRQARLMAGLEETRGDAAIAYEAAATRFGKRHDRYARNPGWGVQASAGVTYEPDLWGKFSRRRESAWLEAQATAAERHAAALTLTGTVATLYWTLAHVNEQIALATEALALCELNLDAATARVGAGAAPPAERARAARDVAARRAAVEALMRERAATRHAFAVLFDAPPETALPEPAALPRSPLPGVRADLPAHVLARRPDVRAAELRLRALWADGEAARAELYPTFALTGSLGFASDALLDLLCNPIGSLSAALINPAFRFGEIALRTRISRARYEEAVANFRQTVYEALAEVETALARRASLIEASEHLAVAVQQARREAREMTLRHQAGDVALPASIRARLDVIDHRRSVARNRLDLLNNEAALYWALGAHTGSAGTPTNARAAES